jgi:Ala-tRNA(Pro) deacylase
MLQNGGVAFQELNHPDAYTAQQVAEREHISGHHVAKVVVVMADGRPVELVLPASRRVGLEQLQTILRARDLRLATEPEMEHTFNDCEVGAIPPLKHWEGIEVIMDSDMQVPGDIVFPAATHHDAVRVRFDDWFKVVNPRVEAFSEPDGWQPPDYEDRDV